MKHTPEPWEIIGKFSDKIYHAKSDTVIAQSWYPGAAGQSPSPIDTMVANAHRIVACVNACAGIETETLESIADTKSPSPLAAALTLCYQRDQYKAQQDKLLAALKVARRWIVEDCHPDGWSISRIDEAIKEVEEAEWSKPNKPASL